MPDRFLIAPFDSKSGLQRNLKPFMIPDEAFSLLQNAYCWRGRIRKRFGSRWLGATELLTRLRVSVGTTNGSGALSGTVPGTQFNVGQMFSIREGIFTVNQTGTPANMLNDGIATTATFNTTSGAFAFTGAAINAPVFWYPALPLMGLVTYETPSVDADITIAFDTQFSYQYNNGWNRLATGDATWIGDNSQFFWATTYIGDDANDYTLFVTNFNENEPMRYYDGTTWTNFSPTISAMGAGITLVSARAIIPFHNRLLVFNTWEQEGMALNNYANRVRYSAEGSPLASDAWRQDIDGQGNGLQCPTLEPIVSVEFIKDRLLVFLDESTWEIVYTGNQIYPFMWQQINTEFGVEGTFSVIPFDKVVLAIGNLGVIACTGNNVERIDEKIPDEVFDIHNIDAGVERIYGIRDYFTEMAYWSFPATDATADLPYPNKVLVYNYKNGTWAFNDDSITAFGYYQPTAGNTWSSDTITWDSDITWEDGTTSALFKSIIGGNQQGWTFIVDSETVINAPALQITNLTANGSLVTINCIDHNLREEEDYVYIQDINGSLSVLNGQIFKVIPIVSGGGAIDPDNFTIISTATGTYNGGGTLARVSNIQINTKQYNFYLEKGRNAYVSKVDFLVDATSAGQIEVDYSVSTSANSMIQDSEPVVGTGALLGTGILETFPYPTIPFEENASQLWHPYYLQADGEFIQLLMYMNDQQMRSVAIMNSDFQMHSMLFHATPSASRLE